MKRIHFFDLDYTLWRMPSKISVINKQKPEAIIHRIPADELPLMWSAYKKYKLKTEYNGVRYFLSEGMWADIQKQSENIKLKDVGISFREYEDQEILNMLSEKTEYIIENIKHIKDIETNVAILTARGSLANHEENIIKLSEELKRRVGKPISKVFFVNDIDNSRDAEITGIRKARVILEHMTGFKIVGNMFTGEKLAVYDEVFFYDDEKNNIDAFINLNDLYHAVLSNTDSATKEKVLAETGTKKATCYEITGNKLNPFIQHEAVIR